MNRACITEAFLNLIYDGRDTEPEKIAKALCVELGVEGSGRAHVVRGIVRTMADCVRQGNTSEAAVSGAVADWVLDFAGASA